MVAIPEQFRIDVKMSDQR